MSVIFPSLRGYQGSWLRNDLVAGATVWAVLVPEALAYATIAGAPPVVGLYAAAPALVLYAMFGSSRHLVVGPMSATAALSAGTIATFADPSGDNYVALTAALAIVTGVVALIAGVLRLGFPAGFISEPVLKGFVVGLALTIIMGQLPKLFGVDDASGYFFERLWGLVTSLGETHWPTFVVGFVSLALVLGLRRYLPLVPGSLVAVALGVIVVMLFHLDQKGVEVVGTITPGLPHLGLPGGVGLDQYLSLAGPAVGVVLVGFADGIGAAKTTSARSATCWAAPATTSTPRRCTPACRPRSMRSGRLRPAPRDRPSHRIRVKRGPRSLLSLGARPRPAHTGHPDRPSPCHEPRLTAQVRHVARRLHSARR